MRRAVCLLAVLSGCSPHGAPPRSAAALADSAAHAWVPSSLLLQRSKPGQPAVASPLLEVLAGELERVLPGFSQRQPPVYHAALGATELLELTIVASDGALAESGLRRWRKLDVDLRVGSPALDNTDPRPDSTWASTGWPLPIEDDELALAQATWRAMESARAEAEEEWASVQAELRLGASADAAPSADFDGPRPPLTHVEAPATLVVERGIWEDRARVWSATLSREPHVEASVVEIVFTATTRTLVTSEGSRLVLPQAHARVHLRAETTAPDGALLERDMAWDAAAPEALPLDRITGALPEISRELRQLRSAPVGAPFVGPVMLEGRAAAILLHEVLGHRLEGDRLRSALEGGTFAGRVGEEIMPRGFDLYDDPTLLAVNGTTLNGSYLFDDEGMAAARAPLVSDGVLVGFLSGRAPIEGTAGSNAHARREAGYRPFTRQGNLLLVPRRVVSRQSLLAALRDEIRAANAPFGLRVLDASGGATTTERADAQSFRIPRVLAYRVAPDGSEELVRGLTLEGTPLALIRSIVLAADSWGIFNGYCGAESGFVPVSAVSPALLVRSLEVTRSDDYPGAPPLLPRPEEAR